MSMNCPECGREAEGEQAVHWLGCSKPEPVAPFLLHIAPGKPEWACEFGSCGHEKRPQGKGPKPKYCEDHSNPKSRK